MLKRLIASCIITSSVGILGACDSAPDSKKSSEDVAPLQFASEDDELAWIDEALSSDPNDPVARRRAAEFNARADRRAGLLHSFEAGEGRVVKFYQSASGSLLIAEQRPVKVKSALQGVRGRSFAEVFSELRPAEAVPDALIEADNRREQNLLQQAEERAQMPAPEQVERAGQAAVQPSAEADVIPESSHQKSYSCTFFKDNATYGGVWSAVGCNHSSAATWTHEGVFQSVHAVAAAAGAVSVRITYGPGSGDKISQQLVDGQALDYRLETPDTCTCDAGLWGACTTGLCTSTHKQEIYNVTPSELFHRNMCIRRGWDDPTCT